MNIILTVSSIATPGGAQRVIVNMANYWSNKGWEVSIATKDFPGERPYYTLAESVLYEPGIGSAKKSNNIFEALFNNYMRIKKMRNYLQFKDPDIVISFIFQNNLQTLLATIGTGIPVIVSERNNPELYPLDPIRKLLRRWLYFFPKYIVSQTNNINEHFSLIYKDKAVIIPNFVLKPPDSITIKETMLPAGKIILAIGSFNKIKIKQKGLDLLIPVYAKLANKHPDWHLVILGDGPDKNVIEEMILDYNMQDRVHLPGFVKDVYSVLKCSDIFAFPSRYEGFPNALCEAMACGLAVVSFDCPTGPAEVIRNGYDGLLVEADNQKAFQESLEYLISNCEERKKLAKRATEIIERFGIDGIMGQWEMLIKTAISGG